MEPAAPVPVADSRVASAPVRYLRDTDPADVARHCALLDPRPRRRHARVTVTPWLRPGTWTIDVIARDRRGLLSAVSGVLAREGVDIVSAAVATWPDHTALESFVAASEPPPDPDVLERGIAQTLVRRRSPRPEPVRGAELTFEDDAVHGVTVCELRSPDRRGLLHDITAAFALAGVVVHVARVDSRDGGTADRFDLTDRRGRPLNERACEQVRSLVVDGETRRRRARFRWGTRSR
jgi:UTP:GlnB (protein PII) uridylyltransferase